MRAVSRSNAASASALLLLVSFFAAAPMLIKSRQAGNNLTTQQAPLTGSQTMRGAYLNTGSHDAGPDPNWVNGKYVGKAVVGSAFAPPTGALSEARARLDGAKRRQDGEAA